MHVRVGLGKLAEFFHAFFHHGQSAHRIDGIALSLQTIALSHDGTEVVQGCPGRSAIVQPMFVGAENEDFIGTKTRDVFRRDQA